MWVVLVCFGVVFLVGYFVIKEENTEVRGLKARNLLLPQTALLGQKPQEAISHRLALLRYLFS